MAQDKYTEDNTINYGHIAFVQWHRAEQMQISTLVGQYLEKMTLGEIMVKKRQNVSITNIPSTSFKPEAF